MGRVSVAEHTVALLGELYPDLAAIAVDGLTANIHAYLGGQLRNQVK